MRRILATFAVTAVMAGVITATSPNAWADRDTGWWRAECTASDGTTGWTIETFIRVIWYASNNDRHIEEVTYIVTQGGSTVDSTSLGFWVLAIGGTWQNYAFQPNPDSNTTYVFDRIPSLNPGQGHYWLARGRDQHNNACDIQVLN